MARPIRIFSRPRDVTSEITQITIQLRSLLRPGERLNLLIIGALAKALLLYPIRIHGFIFLSTHFHILATFPDVERMSNFMKHFTQKLSKEVGILHDWKGTTVFPNRFKHVELSQEPEIEVARLRYILKNSCKEGLVMSPLDWPGVSSTEALITGEPMRGIWIDRRALSQAKSRGEDVTETDFTEELELRLTPIPSLDHLSPQAYRRLILDLVREIEDETVQMHRESQTVPLGIEAVLNRHPHHRPKPQEESPRPWFHALSRESRRAMRTALTWILAAYREAADRYRAGDLGVAFPEGTFPPPRPFMTPTGVLVAPGSWDSG